jgi:sulfoxide reductase heme-binding subunit YedZ
MTTLSDQILWFAARGAGAVSLVLFTTVTILGLLSVTRWERPGWPRFLTAGLHRNLSLLSIAFLAVHIITAITDPFTSLGWVAATVPFASSYRPIWVGLGVIAIDLFLALVATSLLRDRIGQRAWRVVHWLAYGAWPLAMAHSFGSGTDATAPWMLAIMVACGFSVAAALAWRVAAGRSNREVLEDVVDGRHVSGAKRAVNARHADAVRLVTAASRTPTRTRRGS